MMSETGEGRAAPRWASANVKDNERQIDMMALRAYRMGRVQAELRRRDYGAALLFDPMNIRYATGSRNMSVWTSHTPARYCFLPADGKAILFDFHNCEHLSAGLETIAEVRPARGFYFFGAGSRVEEKAKAWAEEIVELVARHCGANRRLAVDRLDPPGTAALLARGVRILDGQEVCELARSIKSEEEIACMTHAIAVCEAGMARMREALRPGLSENELWAMLHETNIRLGGEWIETRILSSGERTNPWFQECGDRLIRAGDLVSFDTDLIGPFGYCADISRTYFCGPGKPSQEQRRLYGLALEQIHYNIDKLMRPGLNFREASELAWRIPNAFVKNRYSCVAHGVGLCDEWPKITHIQDREKSAYDGELAPGMTICVESYMGAEGGREGVKLEQQVLITDKGSLLLSTFPFEEALVP
ncbi:MAG TPA: Xaa-Pro peptidase family protein [Alphaproteobacteria bacterium]|nr:Xaa-Pro peptidase family protein [Alphaproteobacteria bacterium]